MRSHLGRLHFNPEVIAEVIDDAVVLFHPRTDRAYELRSTAARAWTLLAGGRSLPEVTEAMLAEYDVERAVLESDLETIVSQLIDADILRASGDENEPPQPPGTARNVAGPDSPGLPSGP